MKKINEKDVPFKYEGSGPKYLFNEAKFAGGVAYLKPGDEIKAHAHAEETEIFYFVSGTPVFVHGSGQDRVAQGDSFVVPAGEQHGIRNDTGDTVQLTFLKIKEK
jgi:mannose-6-phosphate isomerase-like protein (cupin superfamily)